MSCTSNSTGGHRERDQILLVKIGKCKVSACTVGPIYDAPPAKIVLFVIQICVGYGVATRGCNQGLQLGVAIRGCN